MDRRRREELFVKSCGTNISISARKRDLEGMAWTGIRQASGKELSASYPSRLV